MQLLSGVEIVQVAGRAEGVAAQALAFAGQMARQLGANVFATDAHHVQENFLGRGKVLLEKPAADWLAGAPGRICLSDGVGADASCAVTLDLPEHANEATVFAQSGLADLLGDPERAPLIPRGQYAAGTIGYALLAALCAVAAKWRRQHVAEQAVVNGVDALAWVNWKAALTGEMGRDIHRQGARAEWPVVACADGHVALVYTERDWQPLVDMIDDDALRDERFASFKGRLTHREDCLAPIRAWAQTVSKQQLVTLFEQHQIPAAPVMTVADLLNDPLLAHRQAFMPAKTSAGADCVTPVLPHRVVAVHPDAAKPKPSPGPLPLSGFRVLDLGIITAGAGVSALLADLGAEVLKIEPSDSIFRRRLPALTRLPLWAMARLLPRQVTWIGWALRALELPVVL